MRILVFCEPAKVTKGDEQDTEVPGKLSPMVLNDEELVVRAQKNDSWAAEERGVQRRVRGNSESCFPVGYYRFIGSQALRQSVGAL